jgi:hypothetical protein
MTLAVMVPGVSTPQSGQSYGANASRAVGYSVNGASTVGNNVRIDGTSSSNYNAPDKPMYSPAQEAIETVNVVTNSFDAEQGLAGGAAINVATKTGSNVIHGVLFADHTDQHMKAYAWAADRTQPNPKFLHNQTGGTIGGPIQKDKMFYFVSYEGTFIRRKGQRWATSGVGAMLLGGWQLEAIATVRSGTPFTVTASNTTLNASGSTQFADCVGQPNELGNIYQWYDKSAFASPATGRFGTCKTNSLWGPGLVNVDTGLVRNFRIKERMELKFRAEMFNTANNPHHSNPTNSIASGTFMQALGIANTGREGIDERTVRFSLRFAF